MARARGHLQKDAGGLFVIIKEDIQMEKTKKLNFRITDELHRKLKIIAIKEGRTMNDIICSLIEQYVEQYEEGEDAFK